jgi:hypothetical protein
MGTAVAEKKSYPAGAVVYGYPVLTVVAQSFMVIRCSRS